VFFILNPSEFINCPDLHFPVLSRTLSFNFQDFPQPGKSRKKSRTFHDVWDHAITTNNSQGSDSRAHTSKIHRDLLSKLTA